MFASSMIKPWIKVQEEGENSYQSALNLAEHFTLDLIKQKELLWSAKQGSNDENGAILTLAKMNWNGRTRKAQRLMQKYK